MAGHNVGLPVCQPFFISLAASGRLFLFTFFSFRFLAISRKTSVCRLHGELALDSVTSLSKWDASILLLLYLPIVSRSCKYLLEGCVHFSRLRIPPGEALRGPIFRGRSRMRGREAVWDIEPEAERRKRDGGMAVLSPMLRLCVAASRGNWKRWSKVSVFYASMWAAHFGRVRGLNERIWSFASTFFISILPYFAFFLWVK